MSIIREERIGDCRLILGDCLQVMPLLGKVDAVVTDPPYGMAYVHGGGGGCLAQSTIFGGKKVIGDDRPFDPAPLLDKPCILWGANHFSSRLPDGPSWLVWDKRCSDFTNDQADCEIAYTNLGGPARVFRHLWNGMLKASEKGQKRVHQTQKPVALMEWCLGFLPNAETILDPFAGSGTTGVACVNMGRKFIGIEKDPDYFGIMCKRIDEAHRQADLFVAKPPPSAPTQEGFDL